MLIIHGDDTKKSYEYLQQYLTDCRIKDYDVFSYQVSEIDPTSLRQQLDSTDLFSKNKVIVIHGMLGATKSKNRDELIKTIKNSNNTKVVLYESKELTPTTLKSLSVDEIKIFKINPVIFKLMDSIKPGNQTTMFDLLEHSYSTGIEDEYIFSMLIRQIKLLIQAKDDQSALKISPYAKKMFINQARYFDIDKLLNLHHQLYLIDKKIKSGNTPLDIRHHINHFFLQI